MYDYLVPNTSRKKMIYCVLLVLVFSLGMWCYYHAKQKGAGMAGRDKQQTTVDVASVKRSNLVKSISLSGQTVPEAQVDIAAKNQGRVVAVNAVLGQHVKAGDILIVQDTGDAEISLLQNQAAYQQASAEAITTRATINANYDKAQADYNKAVASYNRNKRLCDIGGISQDSLEVSEQQMADAKAALDTLSNQMTAGTAAAIQSSQAAADKARYTISASEKQRNDLVLTAPRDGIIGYRQIEAGNMVSAGQKLLSLYDNSNMYVDCQISEQDLGAVALNMPVTVQLESLGKSVSGKIIYISPANDSSTLTFSLRIALLNADAAVRSGMFARTLIQAPLKQNALLVAKDALLEKDGISYVFVINAQHEVEQRKVEVGARGDDQVEILTGLTEGEQIALSNLSRLRNGMTVAVHPVADASRGDKK